MSEVKILSRISEYGNLVSAVPDKNEPVYNWHAFKHSYSKKLVEKLVTMFGLKENDWVLDPFSGGGTTLLACKELGINSRGFDILPFSVFLTNVKTRSYNASDLVEHLNIFQDASKVSSTSLRNLPDIGIAKTAFSLGVKKELLKLHKEITNIRIGKHRDFYMLALLSILESVSNTSKAGGFLRITKRRILSKDVRPLFLARVMQMIEDVKSFNKNQNYRNIDSITELADARNFVTERKFDAIITSPPYPNRHDYTRIYGLELIFNFVEDNKAMKQIRYDTLRSHVEARKRFETKQYKEPKIVQQLISKIKKAGINNSKVPEMITGYFEDMYLVLRQMQKSLKKNGKIALVVSNVQFSGVAVHVDEILADIGNQVGLTPVAIYTARYRGNSAQQMDIYKRQPTRESVVVWEN